MFSLRPLSSISILAIVASFSPLVGAQTPHQPSRMITETKAASKQTNTGEMVNILKKNFKLAHNRAGRPKLAVFWNRQLDDQLSQWYTASRNISTHDNWYKGKGFTASQTRLDVETRFDDRPQPNELAGFEFDSGFTRTLLSSGVDIVDRASIMRLTHSKEKEAADKIVVADYQQIEIDALKDYADIVAEVLYAQENNKTGVPIFLITIKKVSDGRIITKFRSRPTQFEQQYEEKWVTTENGYEKQRVPIVDEEAPYLADGIEKGSLEYLGWSVALQTMDALTDYWSR